MAPKLCQNCAKSGPFLQQYCTISVPKLNHFCAKIEQFLHSKYITFIDDTGKLFKWKKSKYVPLKFYKIKKIIKTENECIIIPEKINFSLKINCRLAHFNTHIGLLHTDMGLILYELTDKCKKDTWRKI